MTATTDQKSLEIGDRLITVSRFSTFKAIYAGDLVSQVLNEVPDLSERISRFGQEFRETNTSRMSRAAVELRYPPEQVAKITDEAWQQGGGYLELPAAPGPLDLAAFILPVAFEAARERVLALLALCVCSNSELREADDANRIDEVLEEKKRFLMHSDLGELVDLLAAVIEVLSEQFEGKMGKLRAAAVKMGFEIASPEEDETLPEEATAATTTNDSTSKPPTSTVSDPPTDGLPETPSTASDTPSPVASSIS